MTHLFVAIPETSALIMNIIMKLLYGIYMKISYFFDISLNIGRSDVKQKANNSVRSMLSYPFIFVGILAHTFFLGGGLPLFFGCCHFFFGCCHLSTYILYSCAILLIIKLSCALAYIISPFFARCAILSLHFSRSSLDYSCFFPVVAWIIRVFSRSGLGYSSFPYC